MRAFIKTFFVTLIPIAVIGALYLELNPRQHTLSGEIRGLAMNVNKGATDLERTIIIKFNNMIDAAEICARHVENKTIGTEQARNDYIHMTYCINEFSVSLDRSEMSISHKLHAEFNARLKELESIFYEKASNYYVPKGNDYQY